MNDGATVAGRGAFRDTSIRSKLTLLMSLSTLVGLALAATALIAYAWFTGRAASERDLDTLARIIADHTTAELTFGDRKAAVETLAALRAKPEIELACVYGTDVNAGPFASYTTTVGGVCPARPDAGDGDPRALTLVVPVSLNGDRIGTLRVTQNLRGQERTLLAQVVITLTILGASFVVSFLIAYSAQNLITGPVLSLAAVARRVSDTRDYRLRAPAAGRDEVGRLIEDFNQMLEQIALRDREVRDREARLRAIFENAGIGIIVINAKGIIESFNPAAERLFGYASAEVEGRNIYILMPPPYAHEHDGYLANYLRTGVKKIIGIGREVAGRRRDGSTFPLELSVGEMEVGGERKFTGMVRDITERQRAQEELQRLNDSLEVQVRETGDALRRLREAQAQLVQSEKLASLGALVAGVAHEINTPVGIGVTAASTLLSGAIELKRQYDADALTRSNLDRFVELSTEASQMILKNLQRAADLIHSFKQVAVDQSSGERRRFRLRDYIQEVLLSLGPKFKNRRIEVQVDCPDTLVIDSYPGAIAQILTNFVSNAMMHAFRPDQPGRLLLEVRESGGWVELRFADNGCGIPQEFLPRVFDPFFTTKRGQGGSGLGLHIVFNLVTQRLKGTIQVASEAGNGTTFTIRFPAEAADSP